MIDKPLRYTYIVRLQGQYQDKDYLRGIYYVK